MVVSPSLAGAVSSKPTIERSPGTDRPRSRAACRAASASGSLNANSAVMPGARSSSAWAPARQPSTLVIGTCSTGTLRPIQPGCGDRAGRALQACLGHAGGGLCLVADVGRSGVRFGGEAEARGWRCCDGRGRAGGARRSRRRLGRRSRRSPDRRRPAAGRSATAGESTITVGSCRWRAASNSGSSADIEYTIKPSTAALRTAGPIDGCSCLQPGHEDERELLRIGDVGQALEELHGGRFVEGVGQAPPEDDADGAGATAAQAAGDRIGAAVAEFGRRAQDALAQGGRQPLRPVEGVGHRARGHADGARHGHDPGPARNADPRAASRLAVTTPPRQVKRCKALPKRVKRCKRRVSQIQGPLRRRGPPSWTRAPAGGCRARNSSALRDARAREGVSMRRNGWRTLAVALVVVPLAVTAPPAGAARPRPGNLRRVVAGSQDHGRVRARRARAGRTTACLTTARRCSQTPRSAFSSTTLRRSTATSSVRSVRRDRYDAVWRPVWGEYKTIRNHYNELTVDLREQVAPRRTLQLVFRVFDDGVGFRYVLPRQRAMDRFAITSEDTEFKFADDFTAWWIPAQFGSGSGDEELWRRTAVSEMDAAATPVTIDAGDAGYATLARGRPDRLRRHERDARRGRRACAARRRWSPCPTASRCAERRRTARPGGRSSSATRPGTWSSRR